MFALQYQDSFLELAGRESPVIRWVSTAFNDAEILEGSGSYPIELAASPANDLLLNFSTQLANRLARKDIEVTVYLMGQPWKRCTLTYDLKNGRPSGHLKIDNGELSARLKNISLPDVFVITTAGVFVDHDWIFVGNSTAETEAAVLAALPKGGAPYAFYPFKNSGLFGTYSGEGTPEYDVETEIFNRWVAGSFLSGSLSPESYWFCPALYLTWVIKKVCRFLGYEAVGDFFDSEFINSLVIDNNSVYNIHDLFNEDGFSIAPARHLPEIKLADFFKKLRNTFKLVYYFNSNTRQAHFQLSAGVLSSPERVELDGFIEKKRVSTTKLGETGYELRQAIDSKDRLAEFLPYTKSFFIGETTVPKPVDVPIGTTFMKYETNDDMVGSPAWRIPYKDQLGNAYSVKAEGSSAHNPTGWGRNQWDLKLVSYQGLQQDSLADDYPYATSDGLAPDNTTVLTDSCWLGGARGILAIYHTLWYIFYLRTEIIELSARLTSLLLNKLSPLKKIRWATEEGVHLEALLSQVEFTADERKQLLNSELTVYPFYNQQAADLPGYSNFTGGEIANPDTTYIRMYVVERSRTYRRKFLGAKVLESIIVDVVYDFYSDIAGTIGKSVNKLKINGVRHKTSTDGNSDTPYTFIGDGYGFTEQLVIQFYQKNSYKESYTWTLSAGDYIGI